MSTDVTLRQKIDGLRDIAGFRPLFTVLIIGLSLVAAILEGVGLSFLLPIIETARAGGTPDAGGVMGYFIDFYASLGVPFTLETIIAGVAVVMIVRFLSSFLVSWFRVTLRTDYVRAVQTEAFENALYTKTAYYDEQGSDEILNAIVTQARYCGNLIHSIVQLLEQGLLSLMYAAIALYIAPVLTVATAVVLGVVLYIIRTLFESGYDVGERVADANEGVQEAVQAGTQGIRDVKLFGMISEVFTDFKENVDASAAAQIRLRRNQAAMDNLYRLATALTVFVLIYLAITTFSLSLAELGVFLFAMFRLAPRVSGLNNLAYRVEGNLPHLVRTRQFVDELANNREPADGGRPVPDTIDTLSFEDVSFDYGAEETVLREVSFEVDKDDFAAFVGPSGAGKSTIISLVTRLYEPDSGTITANGIPIAEFGLEAWRSRVSVVRQQPFIFNDTLRYNVTIGNREASQRDIERVCEIAQVTEFLDSLPAGFDTVLGDEGVRLSGGQRQRVALARALLTDAELLVLDEATSDLDSTIEERVHSAIESMDRDYAMMVVAHRLSTVINADTIYVIEDGHIVERGTHEELVSGGGVYSDLYSTQTQRA